MAAEPRLLEREHELATIGRQLDRALDGDGTLTVVEGPAGIGKTRLLKAGIAMARERGMKVLRARGGVLEQQLEFGVVRQMLEHELLTASPERLEQVLAGPTGPALAVLGLAEASPPDTGPGRDAALDVLHALFWVATNLAEQTPIAMVLDDAQWGDASSLRVGGHMATRLSGIRAAFLVAIRDDEPSSQYELLGELFAPADPVHLRPRALSAASVADVVAGSFGGARPSAPVAEACLRASAGNPFVLTQLALDLADAHPDLGALDPAAVEVATPEGVRRSLLGRLERLGPDAGQLARAIATLGGEGDPGHAAAIAGLEHAQAAAATKLLVAAGVVEDRLPLRFAHPLVRAAVAGELRGAREAVAHRRAFEVLRTAGAPVHQTLPHALKAAPAGDDGLVEVLLEGAEQAARTGAVATAEVHLRRALSEPPAAARRGAVLAALGRAEVSRGAFDDGRRHLEQALGLLGDAGERVDAHRARIFAAFASAGMDEARRVTQDGLEELGRASGDGALRLEADLAVLGWLSGLELDPVFRRYADLPGETAAQRTALSLLAQSEHATGASSEAVIELAERALGGGRLVDEDTSEALSWSMATYALLTCEAHDAARRTIAHALDDARRRGSVFARTGALGCRAVLALGEGRPRDAEADARTAADGAMPPIMVPINAAYLVLALVDQGELEEAGHQPRGRPGPTVLRWVPWAQARLHAARGDVAAVQEAIEPLRADDDAGRPMRALAWRALLARVLARAGEREHAQELARHELDWARGWARPSALGVALRAAALAGPRERRTEGLREAVDTLAGAALRTEEARARRDLGVSLLRAGRRRDGRAELERALDRALACGARATARAAAAELEVAGAPPRTLAFDELTASERRVAELAARGASNREIAEALFVTPRTVENHLARVYAKLETSSRAELSEALAT